MSSETIVIRVYSKAGRSRIEIPSNSTFGELKNEIHKRINVDPRKQQLFTDPRYLKKVNATTGTPIGRMNWKSGIILYLSNEDSTITVNPTPQQIIEKKKKEVEEEMKASTTSGFYDPKKKEEEKEKLKPSPEFIKKLCTHGPGGKCINCTGVTDEELRKNKIKHKCKHPPNFKCPNCYNNEFISDIKHVSFEHYLLELRAKCKDKHSPETRCQNCVPPQDLSYKLKLGCKYHKPYPEGVCNKCMPQTAILKRQQYRHIDFVSFMNPEELQRFVLYWQRCSCLEQRCGFLYGYYSEDPNYPMGVRTVIESIYEPPQIGDEYGFEMLEDNLMAEINIVADKLGLQLVGWIFTSINHDVFITSREIRRMAQFQEKQKISHPAGVSVSKFVTAVVKPSKDNQESTIECYMVSDQCQALERDNVFGNNPDLMTLSLREPEKNEMLPTVIFNNQNLNVFGLDYFIVNVGHGMPKKKYDYNIIKNFIFPVENRELRSHNDLKKYLEIMKDESNPDMLNDFHLLIYLLEFFDLDSVLVIVSDIVERKRPNKTILGMFKS